MKGLNLKKIIFVCGALIMLFAFANQAIAQQAAKKRRGVESEFLKKKTATLNSEVSSNVLRIINNSERPITFSLKVSIPDGWSWLSNRSKQYTIEKFDSLFIPVNLTPKKINAGNINHIINAALISDNGMQFASAMWYMSTTRESNWNASLTHNKIFFLDNSDTSHFTLRLQNFGNAEETIKINFSSDRRLRVLDINNLLSEIRYFNLKLPVNTDTSIIFKVEKVKPQQQNFRDFFETANVVHNDYFSLRVAVQNQPDDNSAAKSWRGSVDFIEAGTEAKFHEYSSLSLPLTIEANVDNIVDNSTMLNLNLYGNTTIKDNNNLTYRYQTFFANNFYDYKPFLGNSHYIGYFTPKASVEIGDVNAGGNFGSTANGRGVKTNFNITQNHIIGGFYLNSPRGFDRNINTNYGFNYEFIRGTTGFENFIQFNENGHLNTTGIQYSNRLRFRLARTQSLIVSTAYSRELFKGADEPLEKNGYAYSVNYNGTFSRLNVRLVHTLGSPYNIGYRGIKTGGADLLYKLKGNNSLSASAYAFDQNPQYFSSRGLLLNSRQNSIERYDLKYNFDRPDYNASLGLQHLYSETYNLRSESNGLIMNFRPAYRGNVRFFLSFTGAYVKLLDYNIEPYFASQIRTSLRYKAFNTNLRYYYGPYQSFEQLLFANTKINNQSFYSNTNFKLWLLKNRVSLEPSVMYSYETLYKRSRISLRPEIYYMPKKSSLEVKFYGQYLSSNQKNNPLINSTDFMEGNQVFGSSNLFFGLGIKKRIGIPVSGKKYSKLTVSVFKDLNGNGKQDKNEPGLKNVLVNIKSLTKDSTQYRSGGLKETGDHFITDGQGIIQYANLPRGQYLVKILQLSEESGFFANNEQIITVDKDKDVLMPLNHGAKLSGSLVAQRDPSSIDYGKNVDLSKIRVTAVDSLGKNYSTLTDQDGNFNISMPAGVYQININEGALPDNFELEQKFAIVEMFSVSDIYNVTFFINEKKRKINIKKFDSNGNIINNIN